MNRACTIEPQILVITRLIPQADGTTCDQRIEPIAGTEHARILRVPFRNDTGEVVPHWISRFEIWPYLERFATEVERELMAELGGRPDLIIGNYSDGNLVASLISQRLGVTQCNIAHALEKTKYLYSDLYWRDNEPHYHFSCQFTADLIAMNAADFIITSTYQEIAGTEDTLGQYEALRHFYDARPLSRRERNRCIRPQVQHRLARRRRQRLFSLLRCAAPPAPLATTTSRAWSLANRLRKTFAVCLQNRDKPLLFTMARMDQHQKYHRAGGVVRPMSGAAPAGQPAGDLGTRRPRQVRRHGGARSDRTHARPDGPARPRRPGALARHAPGQDAGRRTVPLRRRRARCVRPAGAVRGLRPDGHRGHEFRSANVRDLFRRTAGNHRGRRVRLSHRPEPRRCRRRPHGRILHPLREGRKLLGADLGRRIAPGRGTLYLAALCREHDDAVQDLRFLEVRDRSGPRRNRGAIWRCSTHCSSGRWPPAWNPEFRRRCAGARPAGTLRCVVRSAEASWPRYADSGGSPS